MAEIRAEQFDEVANLFYDGLRALRELQRQATGGQTAANHDPLESLRELPQLVLDQVVNESRRERPNAVRLFEVEGLTRRNAGQLWETYQQLQRRGQLV